MSRCLRFPVIAIILCLGRTRAQGCEPRALSLPYKDQRLANQAEARGLLLSMGTPGQDVSVVLCAAHADTYIYDETTCVNQTSQACMTSRGGFYDRFSSTSMKPGSLINHVLDGPNANWTKELITLSNTSSLQNFEFGASNKQIHAWRPQAELGLGMNSSFIDSLHAAGNISSKSYAFSWGSDFADQAHDGSITFGGYDRSVVADARNITTAFNRSEPTRCPEGMIVKVTEMSLISETGEMADIFEGLGAIDVCIVSSMRNIMALHEPYGDRIIKGLGAIRADGGTNGLLGGLLTPTAVITTESATFNGNLSITLEGAVAINFTTSQLFLAGDPYLDSAGMVQRNFSSTNVPIVIMHADDTNMPRIGGMFFTPAYLMVNHDKNELSISTAHTSPASPEIIGIDTAHECVAWLNGTVLRSTSSTSEQNVPAPTSDKLATGTIIGISIGAVTGIAFICAAAFFFWRRTKGNTAKASDRNKAVVEKDQAEVFEASAAAQVVEAGFDVRHFAAELDGRTRPTELR